MQCPIYFLENSLKTKAHEEDEYAIITTIHLWLWLSSFQFRLHNLSNQSWWTDMQFCVWNAWIMPCLGSSIIEKTTAHKEDDYANHNCICMHQFDCDWAALNCVCINPATGQFCNPNDMTCILLTVIGKSYFYPTIG